MDLATLFVRFKADTSDVDKNLKGLESSTKKTGDNIAKTLAEAFGAAAIGLAIKGSIDKATELQQAIGSTQTVFGSASKSVDDFAKHSADAFGISQASARTLTAEIGALLQNMGYTQTQSADLSVQLTQTGADLAAAFSGTPEQAVEALTSALKGEFDPLEKYGISLSAAKIQAEALKDGLINASGQVDAHGKAVAALKLIQEQSTTSAGAYTAQIDTAAEAQQRAKAKADDAAAALGQNLLPIYTRIVGVVGDLAAVFGSLPGPIQVAVVALAALVALSGPISTMIELSTALSEALAEIGVSSGIALGGLGALIAVVAGVIAILRSHDDLQVEIAAHSKDVAKALSNETDEITKQRVEAGQGATAAQAYADAQTAMSKAIIDADKHQERLTTSLGVLGIQTKDVGSLIDQLQTAYGGYKDATQGSTVAIREQGEAQFDAIKAMLTAKGVSEDAALAAAEQAAAFANGAQGIADFGTRTQGLTDAQRQLVDALVNVGKSASLVDVGQSASDFLNAAVASSKYAATLVEQAEAQTGASRNGDDAAKVYEAYTKILDNLTPSQRAQITATNDQADAAVSAGTAINDLGLEVGGLSAKYDAAAVSTQSAAEATGKLTGLTAAHDAAAAAAAESVSKLAVEQDQAKANATANAEATAKLNASLDDTVDSENAATKAANLLDAALKKVFGGALDLEDANRALAEGFDKVAASIKDNGSTLDINTDKGRANRAAIEDQVKTIQDKIKADVASGVSIGDATTAAEQYRQKLIETSGSTDAARGAAEQYIDQLGLTPENVSTAVKLEHDEEVKGRLQDLLKQLGDIDAGAAARIQAEIDQGKFDEAEAELNHLARDRNVQFNAGIGSRVAQHSAHGNYFRANSNQVTSIAEPGAGDEVVLPLDDPNRVRQLAASNNVGSRILDALANMPGGGDGESTSTSNSSTTSSSTTVSSGGTKVITGLHVEHLEIHDDTSAQALAQIVMFKLAGV